MEQVPNKTSGNCVGIPISLCLKYARSKTDVSTALVWQGGTRDKNALNKNSWKSRIKQE